MFSARSVWRFEGVRERSYISACSKNCKTIRAILVEGEWFYSFVLMRFLLFNRFLQTLRETFFVTKALNCQCKEKNGKSD